MSTKRESIKSTKKKSSTSKEYKEGEYERVQKSKARHLRSSKRESTKSTKKKGSTSEEYKEGEYKD